MDSSIFRYIRSRSGKPIWPSVMSWGSCVASTPSKIADLFNQYFHSVYFDSTLPVQPPPSLLSTLCVALNFLYMIPLCRSALLMVIKPWVVTEYPVIIKGAATAILEPVHYLFELCLKKASLPLEWHNHYITPIPKSGEKSINTNYRPISLLSSISKLFEKLVFDKLFDFLIESSISSSQFGFICNRSAVKQLLLHTKNIICALERNKQLDTIILDIRKAFDTVPHDLLLLNLWNVGVTGSLWRLLQTYLLNRRQCVSVEGHHSGWLSVGSGMPQSSILGPLLFIININDLPSFVSFSSTLLYADETKLSHPVSSPSDCSLLQLDIQALE